MGKPHICLDCRYRFILSQIRSRGQCLRTPPAVAHINTQSRARNEIWTILNGSRLASEGETSSESSHSRNNGVSFAPPDNRRVGRYSRRELQPEELLGRLESSWASPGSKHGQLPRIPRNREDRVGLVQKDEVHPPRQYDQPTRDFKSGLHTLFDEFQSLNPSNIGRIWSLIKELQFGASNISSLNMTKFSKERKIYNYISILSWELHRWWLRYLSNSSSEERPPRPSEVVLLLQALHLWVPGRWPIILTNTAFGVYELGIKENRTISPERAREAIEELVKIWYMCMSPGKQPHSTSGGRQDPSSTDIPKLGSAEIDWDFLPSSETIASWTADDQVGIKLEIVLAKLVQKKKIPTQVSSGQRILADLLCPTLIMLDVLRAPRNIVSSGESLRAKHSSLLSFLENPLLHSPAPTVPELLAEKLNSRDERYLYGYYSDTFERLKLDTTRLSSTCATYSRESGENVDNRASKEADVDSADPKQEQSPLEKFTSNVMRRIGRAKERHDLYLLDKVRREVSVFAGAQPGQHSLLPLDLYEHLMSAYLAIRQPRPAIEIWDQIIRLGYKPTAKTYTSMMRGAASSRDLSGMQAFWTKMHQASISPDVHAWSVRIFGLIKMKQVKAGLQTLASMGDAWISAARKRFAKDLNSSKASEIASKVLPTELVKEYPDSVDDVPKPNIAIVNSAISALAMTAEEEIPKVLTWGRSFGIEPDLRTYNALLNIAMRHTDMDEAFGILHRMQHKGINADTTTWTVLLTALFEGEFLSHLDPVGQKDTIMDFLTALENKEQGMPGVDVQGYALIIDRLLKRYDNFAAAEAVLQRMINSGQQVTVHIYTILLTSHFQRQPTPDFAAIEALWRRISTERNGYGIPLDSVFFDRMIEGYAQHHRTAGIKPMLGFLERMEQEGKRPGWKALEGVARALAERQEWERLRGIVLDVRKRLESSRGAVQREGQREFWTFILSTGLLRDERITRLNQLLTGPNASPLVQGSSV